MKRILYVIISFYLLVGVTQTVSAVSIPEYAQGETVILAKEKVVNGAYFAGGETVEISGTINGDAYIAGGQININGTINGDLLVTGGQISINGTVTNNVRVIGGQVTISGAVKRNVTVGAGNVEITPSAKMGGDLVAAAGNVRLNAPLPGNLVAGAGSITIAAPITGNIRVGVGELSLQSTSSVGGTVEYWSDKDIVLSPSATISGVVTKHLTESMNTVRQKVDPERINKGLKDAKTSFIFIGLISSLLVGWLLISLTPHVAETVITTLQKQPGLSLIIGLGVVFLVPFMSFLLLITFIGAPLGLLSITGFLLLWYFSKFAVSLWLGNALSTQLNLKTSLGGSLVLGLIVFYLLLLLPTVSFFVRVFGLLFGIGALILAIQKIYTKTRSAKLI